MHTVRKRQNWLTAIFLILYAVAISLWFVADYYPGNGLSYIENVLYVALMIAWAYSVHIRLVQQGLKRYLIAMAAMLALWFVIRSLKYFFVPPNSDAARYLWYLYYLPMMFYPLLALMATHFIGKRDDYVLPVKSRLVYLISSACLLMVLTNDLHQWVFVFPKNAAVYSDVQYSYGIGFYLVFGWFLLVILAVYCHIFAKSRLPEKKQLIVGPVIPAVLGLIYNIAYITGHAGRFSDFISVMSFLTIAVFELCIRTGLIRANSFYVPLFEHSSLAAQIVNEKMQPIYVGISATPQEQDAMKETVENQYRLENQTLYSASPISGGYIVWQEDMTPLIRLHDQLEDMNERLEGRSLALEKRYKTTMKRKRLEEQKRLYNEMQNQTLSKLQALSRLIETFKGADPQQERDYLLQMGIVSAYLKRRNNLIFLAKENRYLPHAELTHCIQESAKNLNSFDLSCQVHIALKGKLILDELLFLYDSLEEILELTALQSPSYFISVFQDDKRQNVMVIRISGLPELPDMAIPSLVWEQEDDMEFRLILSRHREVTDNDV